MRIFVAIVECTLIAAMLLACAAGAWEGQAFGAFLGYPRIGLAVGAVAAAGGSLIASAPVWLMIAIEAHTSRTAAYTAQMARMLAANPLRAANPIQTAAAHDPSHPPSANGTALFAPPPPVLRADPSDRPRR